MVVGGMALAFAVAAPIAGRAFYFWYADLTTGARLAAWIGCALVSAHLGARRVSEHAQGVSRR